MDSKASNSADIISLPKGGGAIRGLGEKFSPDLFTGTGNFTVPLALPPGRNGFQPQIGLVYSTGNGNGPFGLGWALSVPGIARKTSKGIPRYRDRPDAPDPDVFILSGAEDLVPVAGAPAGATRYRPRTEGLFALIDRFHDADHDYWRVKSKDGLTSFYGTENSAGHDPATIAQPAERDRVFAWKLSRTEDPFGNRIEYAYRRDLGGDGPHEWDQLYLQRIRYVDYDDDQGGSHYLVSVTFLYDDEKPPNGSLPALPRPDPLSEYRAGFEIRTRRRCKWIVIETHADAERVQRVYELVYLDERRDLPSSMLPPNRASILSQIQVVGYDDARQPTHELPPLEFDYARFEPAKRAFSPVAGTELPAVSLADPDYELVDLFGSGLPDILELSGNVRYWRNLGGGRFDVPRSMPDAPAGLRLADGGVQLIDADGDGRTDLLVTQNETAGYYSLDFAGGWDRKRSFHRYAQSPSFNLEDPEVRLVDLTGDGVTDAIRSGTRLECYFNDPRFGWQSGGDHTRFVARGALADFPNVNFSDPRVKWADMSGDGLQDIVLVHDGNVAYWPNLGYGRWGKRIQMRDCPRFPHGYDPRRILVGDVDGDGLADLVYVDDRRVTLWINCAGNGWSEPITISGTPAVSDTDAVRLTDLLGNGVAGVLWTRDARPDRRPHYFFLDFTGGRKPYLLTGINNHLGAVTAVSYASSTRFYLADQSGKATHWKTPLPFPVHVVERVEVSDELSGGKLATEYRYHHGYWDGAEREFRGFGMVEQLDTEIFDGYAGRGLPGNDAQFDRLRAQRMFSPPLLARTWFHQGPVGPEYGDWVERDCSSEFWPDDAQLLDHKPGLDAFLAPLPNRRLRRDALRALRGSILRTELYALDGSDLEGRPYTVTESAYALKEIERPPAGETERPHVFFPHPVAQRTTQWERGDEPMTAFSYTSDYDDYGQPRRSLAIACPRGWRSPAERPANPYLATLSVTTYAEVSPDDIYIRDRAARTCGYEITASAGKTVAEVRDAQAGDLKLFAETLNYYDGEAYTGLEFGKLGRYGALVRAESLVLTEDIVEKAYEQDVAGWKAWPAGRSPYLAPEPPAPAAWPAEYGAVPDFAAALPVRAGYRWLASAEHTPGYFASTGAKRYDFQTAAEPPRGLVLAQRNPLGHETTIAYDHYHLLPTEVAAPNPDRKLITRAEYDYRVLQPKRVIDPNGNETRMDFSPSGLVQAIWASGNLAKMEGDRKEPSTRFEYQLRAFHDSKRADPAHPQPVYARAIQRLFHDTDPGDTGETLESRDYSDGFGRLLQTRAQGEEVRFGADAFGGGDAVLPRTQNGPGPAVIGRRNADLNHPNVIVGGWQIYDNKGRVVEQYEPFFDVGWDYDPKQDGKLGRKATLLYDPRGQVVLTRNPDGSEQRVVYGVPKRIDDPPLSSLDTAKFAPTPWEAWTYDANDNAGRTHGDGARSYRHHHDTPASIEVDALGRTVRAVARHRELPEGPNAALPPIEEHVTRSAYDIQGNLLALTDALGREAFRYTYDLAQRPLRTESIDAGLRLSVFDAAGNVVENRDRKGAVRLHAHDDLDRPSRLWARDDADDRLTLREQRVYGDDPNAVANPDSHNLRGQLYRHYDEAGVVTVPEYDFKGNVLESSRAVLSDAFLLRNFKADPTTGAWKPHAPRVDWATAGATDLDPPYTSRTAYDALNRVKWSEYPACATGERYRLRPGYNRAGALERVALEGPLVADGTGPSQPYVERIAYNAKGQRILIAYGNGIMTRYAYDPDTFRLVRLRTEHFEVPAPGLTYDPQGDSPLQDIAYWYDLAGNILGMQDRTPGCGVRENPEVLHIADPALKKLLVEGDALIRCFDYDPLYRLVSATGRACKGIPQPRPWTDDRRCGFGSGHPGASDQNNAPNLTELYWEEYAYDAAGNMLTLRHQQFVRDGGNGAWQTTWSRRFGMGGQTPEEWAMHAADHLTGAWPNPPGNPLTHAVQRVAGGAPPGGGQTHFYDANGNLVRENTERHFEWDHADRLKVFRNQTGDSRPTIYALYLYDAGGQRVKKLVVTGNRYRTTTYLGSAFEHHTEQNLDRTDKAENFSLQVMDDRSRIAIVRVGPAFEGDGAAEHPVQYHLGDHLGSSAVVVSRDGTWINREEFFPYGETSFGSFGRKRYRFTGKERDEESSLNYHSARYFSAPLARWISPDPVMPRHESLFAGMANNPHNNNDPEGKAPAIAFGPAAVTPPAPVVPPAPPSLVLLPGDGAGNGIPRGALRLVTGGRLASTGEAVGAGKALVACGAIVAAVGSIVLLGATVRATMKGEETPIDVADKFYGTHFGDIGKWIQGDYSKPETATASSSNRNDDAERKSFREYVVKTILSGCNGQPHPLSSLLNSENRPFNARDMYNSDNPIFDSGHLRSYFAGGTGMGVEYSPDNRWDGSKTEAKGIIMEKMFVDVCGVPIEVHMLESMENHGLVPHGTAASAPRSGGWSLADGLMPFSPSHFSGSNSAGK